MKLFRFILSLITSFEVPCTFPASLLLDVLSCILGIYAFNFSLYYFFLSRDLKTFHIAHFLELASYAK